MLSLARERDRQRFTTSPRLHQVDCGILHRQLGAEVAVNPLHQRVAVGLGSLRDEVVNIVRPVLDRRIAASSATLHHDFHNGRMQAVAAVGWCGTAFDIVNGSPFIDDDQGSLELSHVLGVYSEVRLQWKFNVNSLRNVDERTTGPDGRIQCGELVVR